MSFNNSVLASALAAALMTPAIASGHCDTMDGPVVTAAQRALASGDLTPALIWVDAAAEPELRDVFARTIEVRRLGAPARELADRYFYDTLVRLHRAGEGEPFTGIEPSGYDVGPAIPAADRALDSASLEPLTRMLSSALAVTLQKRFDEVLAARAAMKEGDLPSGRAYVKAYVEFMHQVERLHEAVAP